MRVRILAVGQHIADWAQEAVRGYLARFPRSWSVDLKEIRTEHRAGQTPAKLMQLEAERLLAAIEPGDFVVVLDEHGMRGAAKAIVWFSSSADRMALHPR